MNRGVTCVLFGSLKINLAAAFWINCRGLMDLAGRHAKSGQMHMKKHFLGQAWPNGKSVGLVTRGCGFEYTEYYQQ